MKDSEMNIGRRELIIRTGVALAAAGGILRARHPAQEAREMYGLIGKMTATPGQRDALVAILLEGTTGSPTMPGCLSYIVAKDPADSDAVWITEVWDSKASHEASLSLPAVKNAIARGRPLIAAFGNGTVTTPVGGHGLMPMGR
jgi:quinol monooxygenase YgiN